MADALAEPADIKGSLGSSVLGRYAPMTTVCDGMALPPMHVCAVVSFSSHPIIVLAGVLWYSRHVGPIEATAELTCAVEFDERELCPRTNSHGFHTSFGRFEVDDQLACPVIESFLKLVYCFGQFLY
jgi:hypothetical protein